MKNSYFNFNTKAEARAFINGVEFVNDSAISICGLYRVPGPRGRTVIDSTFYLHIRDEDKPDRESEKLPLRWRSRQVVKDDD
jgi:hypothetical protein